MYRRSGVTHRSESLRNLAGILIAAIGRNGKQQHCAGDEDFALLNHTRKWHRHRCPRMTHGRPRAVREREPGRDTALSWPGVPSRPGDGRGKQKEQEGSACRPLALCGVNDTQSSAPGSCRNTRSRLQPGTSHLFFSSFWCFVNWRRSATSSVAGAAPHRGGQHQ